jgi:AcrR family transcriptional regulator
MGAIAITDAQLGASATERRILDAALACIARWGLGKTTVDDIAREAGVSRATTYRLFPGGKDTVVDAVVGREVRRFFGDLRVELEAHDDAEALLVAGLGRALRFLSHHAALRAVLEHEPGLLLPQVAFHRLGPVLDASAAFAAPHLRPHVADGPDADERALEVAELLVRVVLSYALQPSAHLDPEDDASLTALVRTHLLPALRAAPPIPVPPQELT